ncbi:MAG: SpaA isopeptide-forming pilin-related protein [Hespellia sp.]|nr:SpaA isopeptide-forming pilin-related protein [Hespellia sp.]
MSKVKKILALVLSMAMIMGMSITSFAADPATNGKITIKGLTASEQTTIKLYQVVSWSQADSNWVIAEWAKDHVTKNTETGEYTFDWDALKTAAAGQTPVRENAVTAATAEFDNLGIGAFLIIAAGTTTEYSVMGTTTYGYNSDNLMVPTDVEVDAKASNYTVVKKFTNDADKERVVNRGEIISFDIDTTFPSYDSDTVNRTFTITDTPTGLKIQTITVTVDGTPVVLDTDYKLLDKDQADATLPAAANAAVTVSFAQSYIGNTNVHAGSAVKVTVTAEVTGDGSEEISNTATTDKADEPSKIIVETGSITINKVDENNDVLKGALFSVANTSGKLQFVEVETGVYRLANAAEIADDGVEKITNVAATNGSVVVKGLAEGTYKIVEEQAPDGYSIVTVEDQTIGKGQNKNVTVKVTDTKLSSLPSTGGIGTTIFTIGGCAIMIIAAFLYFRSRKKEQ